jgi:predicted glycoside hydrolase/deacetylase ChbG (UPF0249 family)
MKNLIITADDFGLVDFIDNGIIESARNGVISNVACFGNVEFSRLESQVNKLKQVNSKISLGIHLTITSHQSLVTDNEAFTELNDSQIVQFKNSNDLYFKDILKEKTTLKKELQAQIDNLKDAIGQSKIDNMSCHQNIFYLDLELFEVYLEVARENNLPIRSPKNATIEDHLKGIKQFESILPEVAREGLRTLPFRYYFKSFFANQKRGIKKRIELMNKMQIKSTNYFMINLYGNPKFEIIDFLIKNIRDEEVCEQIVHLGTGEYDAENIPNGINPKYFEGRKSEFELINRTDSTNLIAQNLNKGGFMNYSQFV